MITCNVPNPDNSMLCDLEVAHQGWHSRGDEHWYDNVWNLDHYCDTEAGLTAPGPTAAANTEHLGTATSTLVASRWVDPLTYTHIRERKDNPLTALVIIAATAAIGFIMFWFSVLLANHIQNTPDIHAHCAYRQKDAYPGHAVCPDSPDNPPGQPPLTDYDGFLIGGPAKP